MNWMQNIDISLSNKDKKTNLASCKVTSHLIPSILGWISFKKENKMKFIPVEEKELKYPLT